DPRGTLSAQYAVEANGSEQIETGVDDIDLVKIVRQIAVVAQIVDRLPYRPERRDGDELRLHPPAGGFLWKVQAALERDAFENRHLLEDLVSILFFQILKDIDRIIAIEIGHAARNVRVR